MFGNISGNLLETVSRSKREQDLKDAQAGYLRHQILANRKPLKPPKARGWAESLIHLVNLPKATFLKHI
jgi:hypothetical protein